MRIFKSGLVWAVVSGALVYIFMSAQFVFNFEYPEWGKHILGFSSGVIGGIMARIVYESEG